jgi:hypothetical protein
MRRENLGIANRNPLNIRHSTANRWLGLCPHRLSVKGFCHFLNFAYGYRAAVVLIKNYILKHGADTPRKIIARWAPPSENQTDLYIACVCGRSRLAPDEKILAYGPQIARLVAAMAKQETGVSILPEEIEEIRETFKV